MKKAFILSQRKAIPECVAARRVQESQPYLTNGKTPDYNLRGWTAVRAFTLIELLVVVLIIGILAAIALPQYQKAVFKSRFTQALINHKTIENCFDMYILANGLPASGSVSFRDMGCPVDQLVGGEWHSFMNLYAAPDVDAGPWVFILRDMRCTSDGCDFTLTDQNNYEANYHNKVCKTREKPLGRIACQMLQELGYESQDVDF